MRSSACDTHFRHCVRSVLCWLAFPLAPALGSTGSAVAETTLFVGWSLTSRDRASSATAPRLPDADRRLLPTGRSRDLPVPAQGASAHARVSDHAGSSERSR